MNLLFFIIQLTLYEWVGGSQEPLKYDLNITENEWILNKIFGNQLLSNFTSPIFGVGVGNSTEST